MTGERASGPSASWPPRFFFNNPKHRLFSGTCVTKNERLENRGWKDDSAVCGGGKETLCFERWELGVLFRCCGMAVI